MRQDYRLECFWFRHITWALMFFMCIIYEWCSISIGRSLAICVPPPSPSLPPLRPPARRRGALRVHCTLTHCYRRQRA
jgi:hypothetical protein